MKHLFKFLIAALPLVSLSSCGGNKNEETEEAKSTLGAFKELADRAEEMTKKEPVEPVTHQELKEILPGELAGIPRTETESESNQAIGFKVSLAKGRYSNDDKQIDLNIMDLGGVGGFAVAGLAAWTLAEGEKETATGYERTIKLDGHKAFEKYNNESKQGDLKLFFNERYLVSLESHGLSMDEIKSAYRQLELSKLPKD